MGLHPCSVNENYEQELAAITAAARANKIFAIGEIGMDLYWDKTFEQAQREVFFLQIELAKELSLPIVIHCRKAFDETLAILKAAQAPNLRGIFHCFSGSLQQAHQIIDLGFYLGIGGVLTYKNAGLAEVIKEIDLAHLVLETDSPYLSPVPFRGKPNESAYLIHVAEKLATLKSCTLAEIAEQTTANSKKVFGI
jgi:TatD DNase family protein